MVGWVGLAGRKASSKTGPKGASPGGVEAATKEGSVSDAGVVRATAGHPFWDATTSTWVRAGDLSVGDRLYTAPEASGASASAVVPSVHTWTGRVHRYNLTVDDTHTYYVSAGGVSVLVHNDSPIPSVDNEKLQSIVTALFHGVGNPNQVGDGSAMASASSETLGGALVENRDLILSTTQWRNSLVNFLTNESRRLRSGKKVPIVRSARDIQVATSLISAIDDAHAGKYEGLSNYDGLGGC